MSTSLSRFPFIICVKHSFYKILLIDLFWCNKDNTLQFVETIVQWMEFDGVHWLMRSVSSREKLVITFRTWIFGTSWHLFFTNRTIEQPQLIICALFNWFVWSWFPSFYFLNCGITVSCLITTYCLISISTVLCLLKLTCLGDKISQKEKI